MTELVVVSLLNGVLYGMLLFLMASGLTLIFSMMGVLNFAHASFYMLGAFFGYQISRITGFWIALVVAPVLVGGLGALVERYGLRTVHRHGHVAELLFTFGLAYVIEEVVQIVWGKLPVDYRVPAAARLLRLHDLRDDLSRLQAVHARRRRRRSSRHCCWLLGRTRIGLIIQAALTHPQMVAMLGHDVPRVFMLVFGLGTGLAAVAGVIAGPALVTQANMAGLLGPILFVVVVVGGLGSLAGAFVASLAIGLIQTFAAGFDGSPGDAARALGIGYAPTGGLAGDVWNVTVAQVAPVLPYLLLVAVLILRPTGLLGRRET